MQSSNFSQSLWEKHTLAFALSSNFTVASFYFAKYECCSQAFENLHIGSVEY